MDDELDDLDDEPTLDEQPSTSLSEVVEPWLARYALERSGVRRWRLELVGAALVRCIDAEAESLATAGQLPLLQLERQFGEHGAASRVIDAAVLPSLLQVFVSHPWVPTDPGERRAHLQVVSALSRLVERMGLVGWYCDILDVDAEVRRLRDGGAPRVLDRHRGQTGDSVD